MNQVIQVAGQPDHAVHHHSVPIVGKPSTARRAAAGRFPARSFVDEDPVQDLTFELSLLVLIQRADPNLPSGIG